MIVKFYSSLVFFSKTCPWVNFAALLEKWWLPVPIMQLHGSSRLGIFGPTWSLCHPRMSAIQATRFLPPLQFKFSAAAVFVKAPPGGHRHPGRTPVGLTIGQFWEDWTLAPKLTGPQVVGWHRKRFQAKCRESNFFCKSSGLFWFVWK